MHPPRRGVDLAKSETEMASIRWVPPRLAHALSGDPWHPHCDNDRRRKPPLRTDIGRCGRPTHDTMAAVLLLPRLAAVETLRDAVHRIVGQNLLPKNTRSGTLGRSLFAGRYHGDAKRHDNNEYASHEGLH